MARIPSNMMGATPPSMMGAGMPRNAMGAGMAKTPAHMRNLARASAKHLLSMGHISQAHHDKIMAASGAPGTIPKMPTLPKAPFGALAKRPAAPPPVPGAAASLPGIGGTPAVPGVTNGMGNILPPGFMADES